MSFFVYILLCADGTYYTGCTKDLEKRIKQHNHSKSGAHYTKIRRPVELILSESYESLAEARAREAAIKRLSRTQKELLISQFQT